VATRITAKLVYYANINIGKKISQNRNFRDFQDCFWVGAGFKPA